MLIKIAIVEDDARVRESLASLITTANDFRCVGQFGCAEDALLAIPQLRPHVVLMDINLPGLSGVECVRKLKEGHTAVQIVMLTVYENTDHIFDALAAGATGYLLKKTPPGELFEAIRDVFHGGSPMTSHIARKVVQSLQKSSPAHREHVSLSTREQQVLEFLARGYLYKEIADSMHISFETVRTYIRRIYEKLHVRSRTEAVAKYLQP